jgi:ubiquinone/menaquinone biosynthesis C-methylase UbiE
MEPKLQRRMQRYGWDKAMRSYEQYWGQQLESAQSRLLKMTALQRGEWVVDVACGTGLVTVRAAASVGPEGVVVGTDISAQMVARASTVAARQHLSHTTFAQMNAEALQLPDGTFDVALCALGLMYVPDPIRALQEMHRVLKPSGRAGAVVWGPRDRCGWAAIFPIVEARVQSEVCPLFFQLGTQETLGQALQAAGFQEVESERLATMLHYETPEDACGAAFAGGPVALAYARFDAHTRQAAYAEYVAAIAPYRSGNGYEIPGEFVIACGRKR